MIWVESVPWTFRRAKDRRRVIRGTVADRRARGWYYVRERIQRVWGWWP